MIMPVMWFAPAEAQVVDSDKTHRYPQGSMSAVACRPMPSGLTRDISRGHRLPSTRRA